MRPRIEGVEQERVIQLVNSMGISPTELINTLINNHYKSIYPSGKDLKNGNTEETQTSNNQ